MRDRGPAIRASKAGSEYPKQFGKYQVLSLVGQSGGARVYRARQASLGRLVTLTILPRQEAEKPAHRTRFERQVAAAKKKTLVLIFLRGGMDGLNLIVPHGESAYYAARNRIGIPRPGQDNGAIDLDGKFGLHPFAAPLAPLFEDGRGLAVHAVGNATNTRSHFEEQDTWETGLVESTVRSDGWMNRHLPHTILVQGLW